MGQVSAVIEENTRKENLTEEQSRKMFPLAWAWNDLVTLVSRSKNRDIFLRAETLSLGKSVDEAVNLRLAVAKAIKAACENVLDQQDEPITEEGKKFLAQANRDY